MRKNCLILLTIRILAALLVLTMLLFSGLTRGERIALDALTHLGAPYVLGKAGPEKFDCSGLVLHCFKKWDISLAHSAEIIGTSKEYPMLTDPRQLLVGDVVCFDTVKDRDPSDHVGIWLGGNSFVHASSSKGEVVISQLEGYYLERFTGAKRLLCPYF